MNSLEARIQTDCHLLLYLKANDFVNNKSIVLFEVIFQIILQACKHFYAEDVEVPDSKQP